LAESHRAIAYEQVGRFVNPDRLSGYTVFVHVSLMYLAHSTRNPSVETAPRVHSLRNRGDEESTYMDLGFSGSDGGMTMKSGVLPIVNTKKQLE
jgi:hypothetical protein